MKSEWNRVQVGELCSRVCSGGTPKSTNSEYYGGDIPWLNTREVNFNRISKTEGFITQAGLDNSSAKWIKKNCVIVAMYGATAGRCAITKIPLTTNQACCNLEIDDTKADYRFVYYALKNEYVRLSSAANGGAQQNLNAQQVKEFDIPYPPLPIQRKIASIFSALDDKIETNNAICRNLEELLLAVYRNVKYANECVVKELHELAEFSKNKKQIFELNSQSYFSTENMLPGKAGAVAAASLPTMPKATACSPGDILVSNIRPYFKKIVYCSTKCGCSSDVLCIHPKEEVYSTWLFCSLYEDDFFDYVTAGSKGTKMPRGDKAHIMRYSIAVPARTKLEEFKSMGNLVLTQINNLRSENEYLSQLRDSILPKLMNGELDIDKIEV